MNPSGDQFHCDMNFGLKAESSTYEYFPVDWKTKGGRVLFDARNIAERRIIDNMQIYISEMLKQTNKNVFVTSTKSFQKTRLHMHGKQVNACLYSAVTDKEPKKDGAPDPSSRIIRAGDIVKVKLHPAGFKIAHRNVEGQSHQVAYKGRKVVSQFACRVVGLQTGQEIRDVSVPIIHGHLELELYPPCMFPPKLHGKFCLALTSRLDKLQVMGADEIRETFKSLAALLPKKRLDVEVKVCNQWVVLEDAPCQRLSLRGSLPPLRVKLMGSAGSAAPLTHWSAATAYDAKQGPPGSPVDYLLLDNLLPRALPRLSPLSKALWVRSLVRRPTPWFPAGR